MSWMHVKCLNTDPEFWGMKNTSVSYSDFNEKHFESVLKRCGRFLKNLDFDNCKVNKNIVDLIRRECPNLKNIDFDDCYQIYKKNDIEDIKPIFNKVKKFNAEFQCKVTDKDLKNLFSTNDKLEYLNLNFCRKVYTSTFLDALPYETLKELIIYSYIPLNRIFQVSITF